MRMIRVGIDSSRRRRKSRNTMQVSASGCGSGGCACRPEDSSFNPDWRTADWAAPNRQPRRPNRNPADLLHPVGKTPDPPPAAGCATRNRNCSFGTYDLSSTVPKTPTIFGNGRPCLAFQLPLGQHSADGHLQRHGRASRPPSCPAHARRALAHRVPDVRNSAGDHRIVPASRFDTRREARRRFATPLRNGVAASRFPGCR